MTNKKGLYTSNRIGRDATDPGRRRCLQALGSAVALSTVGGVAALSNLGLNRSAVAADTKKDVFIVRFSAAGKKLGKVHVPKVIKTTAKWQQQLSHEAYVVTRHEGTERAFSGQYWNSKADGIYHCICCKTALYDSRTKFHSGTGWPSFWQPIASENITARTDRSIFGMTRTKIACKRCNAHLGHVFHDGPQPTGLRYCMNSVALHLVSRTQA